VIKRTLIDALGKTVADSEFKERLKSFAEEPALGGPEVFRKSIQESGEIGLPLVRKLGLLVSQ
jgi:hypothetical protein